MKQCIMCFVLYLFTSTVSAQVIITEIMYDALGSDTNREWVEIQNISTDTVNVLEIELIEATENSGRITLFEETNPKDIAPGEFAIITTDASKFRADYPNFTGKLFKNTFSLTNSAGKNLTLRRAGTVLDSYLYDVTLGAAGDGNTLQRNENVWVAVPATPGLPFSAGGSSGGTDDTGTTPPPTGGTGGSTTTTTTTPPSTTPVTKGSGAQFALPQLFGAITSPAITLAGVDTTFTGRAFTTGGREINYAKYGWNFGDGTIENSTLSKVIKRYKYPGVYSVAVDVTAPISNTEITTTEYISITVVPPEMTIAEGVDSEGGRYIEIQNKTQHRVDMSQWVIVRGSGDITERYMLPKNTFIMPQTSVRIAEDVIGFKYGGMGASLELRFSNEKLIAKKQSDNTLTTITDIQKNTIQPIVQKSNVSQSLAANPTFGGVPVLTASINGIMVPTVNSTLLAKESVQTDDVAPEKITSPAPVTVPQVASVLAYVVKGKVEAASTTVSTTTTATTTLVEKVISEKTDKTSLLMWYVLFGLLGLGGVFVLMQKHNQEHPKDEYTIIEDEK